jgi:chitosanase
MTACTAHLEAPTSREETVAEQAPTSREETVAERQVRADRLVSVFENGTPDLRYDYVEDIHDGRGYTCGRGFTTRTGDVARVVKDYVKRVPSDPLARFVPALDELVASDRGDVGGLDGFPDAWKAAAKNAAFRAAQDGEVERSSWAPARAHAAELGVTTALGLTILYDSVFMHGDGEDADGTPALIDAATTAANGTPKTGVPEHAWLERFLDARRADLVNAHDPTTRDAWREAATRVDVLRDELEAGNDDLHGPIAVAHGYDAVVP